MTDAIGCSAFSSDSNDVHRHFALAALATLNVYACATEDALLKSQAQQWNLQEQLSALNTEREQMRSILTNPEQLNAYARGFFGLECPCPGGTQISRLETGTTAR